MLRTLVTVEAADVAMELENRLRERLVGDELAMSLFSCYADLLDTLVGSLTGDKFLAPYDDVVREGAEHGRLVLQQVEVAQ